MVVQHLIFLTHLLFIVQNSNQQKFNSSTQKLPVSQTTSQSPRPYLAEGVEDSRVFPGGWGDSDSTQEVGHHARPVAHAEKPAHHQHVQLIHQASTRYRHDINMIQTCYKHDTNIVGICKIRL